MSEFHVMEGRFSHPATTSDERTWAALAHASTLLTLLVSMASAGIGGLLLVFLPLAIYLSYKDRSPYVAYHAAQAFALQVVGTAGFLVAILAAVVVLAAVWVVTALLSVILIGLILIPIALLLTLLLVFVLIAVPFVIGGFSIAATAQTANGVDYEYPYLGRWVRDWLARSGTPSAPAV